MRYTIVIGNAIPVFNKDKFPVLEAYWEIDNSYYDGYLPFPCKKVPRYFSFGGFAKDVGLSSMFNFILTSALYNTSYNRKCAVGIRKEDADYVTECLDNFKKFPEIYKKSNGCLYKWRDENNYYYNLEVLIWLEHQMQFAVKNFDTPAMYVCE